MIPLEIASGWLARKLERRSFSIASARTVDVEHKRVFGATAEFARVVLTATPAHEFSFESRIVWPAAAGEGYNDHVLDGILDEVVARDLGPTVSRVAYRLDEIGWHNVDSCPNAFYMAARKAVRDVLGERLENIDFAL